MTLLKMESPAFPHGRSVDKREEVRGRMGAGTLTGAFHVT